MTTIPERDLPAPRLELRWVDIDQKDDDGFRWTVECIYSLVIKLGKYDIRRERVDEKGRDLPKVDSTSCEIGRTRSTGTAAKRHNRERDDIDTPFRDHAHASWDRKQLGDLPVYAVAAGRAMLVQFNE